MPEYTYKTKTLSGKVQTGKAEAATPEELIRTLRETGLFCYQIEPVEAEGRVDSASPLKLKLVSSFCRQMATMLKSGVGMARALDIVRQSAAKKKLRVAAARLYEGVQKGQSLSDTMKDMGRVFPELLIYIVETGETSGTLDVVMEKMAVHFENEVQLRGKVQTALIYPCILAGVSVISVGFMLTYVLPQFISMYDGVDLPAPTQLLLNISSFVTTKWNFILLAFLGLILLWTWLNSHYEFRAEVKRILMHMPVVGKLLVTIYTSRFASTFSVLYASGISILRSIDVTSRVLGNEFIEQKLMLVEEDLKKGDMLSESLSRIGVFGQLFLSMVLVGEEAGSLDEILNKTGDYFEQEAASAMSRLVALLEPAMIVILGIVIGFIVIAMIMPIFSMYGQVM